MISAPSANRPQQRDYPTPVDNWVGSFKVPDRTSRDLTSGLTSLSTDGVAKDGRSRFNSRPGRGLNRGLPPNFKWESSCSSSIRDFLLQLSMICFCLETRFIHTIRETLMPSTYFLAEQISGKLLYVFRNLECC